MQIGSEKKLDQHLDLAEPCRRSLLRLEHKLHRTLLLAVQIKTQQEILLERLGVHAPSRKVSKYILPESIQAMYYLKDP